MATFIDMPKLSDTMTVGTVATWLKQEGDAVESGDVLAEIETDKATMELEAFEDGILLKQIVTDGQQVAIGEPIAVIGEEGESFTLPTPSPSAPPPSTTSEEVQPPTAVASSPESAAPEPVSAPSGSDTRIKASPLAKKLAADKGIDLAAITGTGPNGRIVKKDILSATPKSASTAPSAPPSQAVAPSAQTVILPGLAIAEDANIPVSNMRGVIARRLVESKTTAPHFYLQIEVNAGNLLETRARINTDLANVPPENGGGIKLTVNDFILKASAEALRRVPAMNRAWQETSIHQSGTVHLAFGVAIDDGLLTPVIRNAESKTLKQIALEAKELIGKARSKKLSPDEMSGSTFTVTNLGMFGISSFYGIINIPNAGILSVGATVKKPIVNDAGEIVPAQIMTIGLSGDHRVVDGAVGAQYLQALKTLLETPALSLI